MVTGDDRIIKQVKRQLEKLVDVIDIKMLKPNESVHRELMLIKVRANKEERQNLIMISDVFRAKIVDVGTESLIIELTGSKSKLEGFMELL